MADLPKHARAVIIGGGVIGCSIAYHLSKLGWSDVVLLERKQLTSGTTWHAAGLIGQLRQSMNMTRLARYTAELYRGLEAETGQATGYRQCGSISLATTPGAWRSSSATPPWPRFSVCRCMSCRRPKSAICIRSPISTM